MNLGAGQWGSFYNNSSGNLNAAAGVNGTLVNVGSGSISTGFGLGSYMFNTGSGTVTNGGGLYVAAGNVGTEQSLHSLGLRLMLQLTMVPALLVQHSVYIWAIRQMLWGDGSDPVEAANIFSEDGAEYAKNIINGNNYFNADINPEFRGDWLTNSSTLPVAVASHTATYHNGYIYVLGGNDGSSVRDEVYYAPV